MLMSRQDRRLRAAAQHRRSLRVELLEMRALLTTFFVDGDLGGSDADGSAAAPFATIQQAIGAAIANPGDDEVVIVPRADGRAYEGTVSIAGGSADAGKLTLRGATGHGPDVVLTTHRGEGIYIGAAFEVTIRDLKISETAHHGILSRSQSVVNVENVHIVSAGVAVGGRYSGIVHQRGDLIVRDSLFSDNWQGIWSAELRDPEGLIVSRPSNLQIENTVASQNLASGFYTRQATGAVSLVNVSADGNVIHGLRAYELPALTVRDSVLSNNGHNGASVENVLAPTLIGSSFPSNQFSGAWFTNAPDLTISESELVANGLDGLRISDADGATIDRVVVDSNGSIASESTAGGGGIGIFPATAAPIVISNSKVSNNKTRGNGGGIGIWAMENAQHADVTVANTEVSGNTIAPAEGADGGGIAVIGYSHLTLVDSVVQGNSARGTGGVHFQSYGTADGGVFPTLAVIGSTISENVSIPTATHLASRSAGLVQLGGWLDLQASTLAGNQGGEAGGARLESWGGAVSNTTISGNQGLEVGGLDLWNARNPLNIRQATLTGNQGRTAGGLRSQSAQVTLGNSVVASNTRTDAIASDLAGAVTTVGGNLFGETDAVVISDHAVAGSDLAGTVAQPLDPELGPLQDNGGSTLTHLPLPDSPLIDGGIDALVDLLAVDQRGEARVQGSAVDIGAVETFRDAPTVLAKDAKLNLNAADKGNKTVTLIVHSSATLDATRIDLSSLLWAGGTVAASSFKDVDGDGRADLVLQFRLRELDLVERYRQALIADDSTTQQQVDVPLSGRMSDGTQLHSSVMIELMMAGKPLRDLMATL